MPHAPRPILREKVAASAATFFGVITLLLAGFPAQARAQDPAQQPPPESGLVRVDTIAVEGNRRVARESVLNIVQIPTDADITFRDVQTAIKALFATGQFENVQVLARDLEGDRTLLVLRVEERPLVRRVAFEGLEHLREGQVRDSSGLSAGEPYSPTEVLRAQEFIRAKLSSEGIPFARIEERIEPVDGMENVVDLVLDVTEGQRVTVADVQVQGNTFVSTEDIEGAMATRPEGFLWFRPGSYDEERYRADLSLSVPSLYRSRGYLDFEVLEDTLIIDPETGKARIELTVSEGPQYRVADFTVEGNREFETEQLTSFFRTEEGGLLRSLGIGAGGATTGPGGQVFDQVAFEAAAQQVQRAYANEGYIYAQVVPVVEKNDPVEGEPPTVDVSWRIQEGIPAHVRAVTVAGNDYTYDWVVRDKIFILPGDRYSLDRVIQSYQSIASLGFFETPLPEPEIVPDPETGDVDITFHVQERQTASVNFGTSVGGGVGLSGFLGFDHPNLFGQAKEGHLRWDFGRYLNSFSLTFADPAIRQSRMSGQVSLFNSSDRFIQFASGRRKRRGVELRFGFPVPGALRTRVFTGYSISKTTYRLFEGVDDTSLFGRPPGYQSTALASITRSTVNHPIFPTSGSRQSLNAEFNGGPLGGDAQFTKLTGEGAWWVPVGQVGGGMGGGSAVRFAFGLTLRGGAIFGDASAFPFDQFWMGGVQFGQQLRGYDETTITPVGFFGESSREINDISRLGGAFMSLTAEYAMRLSDNISISTFFDAGNVWSEPQEFDPTRLFRGAGLGVQLVTPFGPIGLDYAYGFDKPQPGWQFHFRMGPGY